MQIQFIFLKRNRNISMKLKKTALLIRVFHDENLIKMNGGGKKKVKKNINFSLKVLRRVTRTQNQRVEFYYKIQKSLEKRKKKYKKSKQVHPRRN